MAAFAISFQAVQAADGKSITFTDLSNWTTNTEGYLKANFVRTFNVKDAYGAVVDTLVLPTDADSISMDVDKNLWLETTFVIDGAQDYSLLQKQLFDRLMAIAYRNAINDQECCTNQTVLSNVNKANIFLKGVDFAVPVGNGVDVQKFEDIAYSYLSN